MEIRQFDSAEAFVKAINAEIESFREGTVMASCETRENAMKVSNICAIVSHKTIESLESSIASDELAKYELSLVKEMVKIGALMIQKWVSEKAAEFEDLDKSCDLLP